MPAFIIVDIEVRDPVNYEAYKRVAPESIAKYGGRYVVRGGRTEILEGSWRPNRFVMLEFDSVEKAKAWWASEEYRVPKEMRQAAATTNMILVEGIGPA